ncbi:hypothetical protein FOZ60_000707 [Perkinsus olseni]|uniref:Uncharacterized protein n=1 Tax=Perkinsus olseni TaxID=32597 RepID=A0A7J6P1J9_PEROL|nr:hypothetical protein FOZ60_000707 [Perkinsus olseni]
MGCASSTVEVAEGEVYAIKMSGAKQAERSEYEVSKYEEPNIEDTEKEEGTIDEGGEKPAIKGGSEPAVMNPAEVPILVGASPDSVEEWHRKRRRSSNDFEEQMWKRCDFGNGSIQHVPLPPSSMRQSPSSTSPLCTILEDSPLSSRQLHYYTPRSSVELTGARSSTTINENWRRSCNRGMPHHHERRRREQFRAPPRYRYRRGEGKAGG